MTNIEITNYILNYFAKRNINTKLDLSIDEESNSVQVQINVDISDNADQFAFFYALADEKIFFSTIYELDESISKEEFNEFKLANIDNLGPFSDFIQDDEDTTLHLYGEVEVEEFNEALLDNLFEYCNDETSMCSLLKSLENMKI